MGNFSRTDLAVEACIGLYLDLRGKQIEAPRLTVKFPTLHGTANYEAPNVDSAYCHISAGRTKKALKLVHSSPFLGAGTPASVINCSLRQFLFTQGFAEST